MPLPNQEFYEDYIFSCNKCKSCTQSAPPHLLPSCAPFELNGFFSYSGGGKAHIAQAIVQDKIQNFDEISEYFHMCSMCMACKQMCPIGLDHYYLIWDVRRRLFKKDAGIPQAWKALLDSTRENNNPWSLPAEEKGEWLIALGAKDFRKESCENLYFAGCAAAYEKISPAGAKATLQLLQKAGVDFGVLGSEEPCCGAHACEIGDFKFFKKTAKNNAAKFAELGVKKIIVSDPHCYACFKNNYPDVTDDMPPVVHVLELLASLVENGDLKPARKLDKTVTFHDPCRLSRHTELSDAPRKLLAAVLEKDLVEMPRTRESTYCCGSGAGMGLAFPEVAEFATAQRLEEARETGAQSLVTACPYCMQSLDKAARSEQHGNPQCVDLLPLLAECF